MMLQRLKQLIDLFCYPLYLLRGRRPWTPGYYTAKKWAIEKSVDQGMFTAQGKVPAGFGASFDERVVEYSWVYGQLPADPGKMLDAGSALNHEFLLVRKPVASADLTICTLSPEKRCFFDRSISYVYDDLRDSMLRSDYFDTVVSISTIEHIGLDNTMLYTSDASKSEADDSGYLAAVREFRRVIKPGGVCLITVPFGKPAVRGWFQVFDPSMIQSVIDAFQPVEYQVDYFAYEQTGWHRSSAEALAKATFFDIHQDKPYDADMAAGARGVACIRMEA